MHRFLLFLERYIVLLKRDFIPPPISTRYQEIVSKLFPTTIMSGLRNLWELDPLIHNQLLKEGNTLRDLICSGHFDDRQKRCHDIVFDDEIFLSEDDGTEGVNGDCKNNFDSDFEEDLIDIDDDNELECSLDTCSSNFDDDELEDDIESDFEYDDLPTENPSLDEFDRLLQEMIHESEDRARMYHSNLSANNQTRLLPNVITLPSEQQDTDSSATPNLLGKNNKRGSISYTSKTTDNKKEDYDSQSSEVVQENNTTHKLHVLSRKKGKLKVIDVEVDQTEELLHSHPHSNDLKSAADLEALKQFVIDRVNRHQKQVSTQRVETRGTC